MPTVGEPLSTEEQVTRLRIKLVLAEDNGNDVEAHLIRCQLHDLLDIPDQRAPT